MFMPLFALDYDWTPLFLQGLLACPLVLGVTTQDAPDSGPRTVEELHLTQPEGRVLRKTFSRSRERDMTQRHVPAVSAAMHSRTSSDHRLVVTEAVLDVEGSRMVRARRSYEEACCIVEMEHGEEGSSLHSESVDGMGELEGVEVLFTLDEADGALVPSSEGIDDELLADLSWDLDFRVLLPNRPVVVGEQWDLDVAELLDALDPWEELPYSWFEAGQVSGGRDGGAGGSSSEAERECGGKVTARMTGLREEGGALLAVLELEGRLELLLTTETDQSFDGHEILIHRELESLVELEGVALWNVTAGHLQRLELEHEADLVEAGEDVFRMYGSTRRQRIEGEGRSSESIVVTFEEVEAE